MSSSAIDIGSKYPFLSICAINSTTSLPTSGTDTLGTCERTISLSTGLSSINTKLSTPIFIDFAISKILWFFGFQLALNEVKSSNFKILSGWLKPSLAFSKSFLEQTARVTPLFFNSLTYFWNAV